MPQLGETVTEGTITRWLKQVGEPVARDEPLFEVSTDKVDSEVPSPFAGVSEIRVPEGGRWRSGAAALRSSPVRRHGSSDGYRRPLPSTAQPA